MVQQPPKSPHLADLFRTALAQANPAETQKPEIVINGSHNVVALGGTVYMGNLTSRNEEK